MVVKDILNKALALREKKDLMAKVAEGGRITKEDKDLAAKFLGEITTSLEAITGMQVEEVTAND